MKPYYFSFTSHAKGRWVGSRVYDIFCREFQAEKPEFYVSSGTHIIYIFLRWHLNFLPRDLHFLPLYFVRIKLFFIFFCRRKP